MSDTIDLMEDMRKQIVTKENQVEMAEARYKSIVQIQEYMAQIAESTKTLKWSIEKMPVNIYWLNRKDGRNEYHCLSIYFNMGSVCFEEPAYGSDLCWSNFCSLGREDVFEYNSDSKIRTEFILLLEKWEIIKSIIETSYEKILLKLMKEKQKQVEDFKERYIKATNFQV